MVIIFVSRNELLMNWIMKVAYPILQNIYPLAKEAS